MRGLKSLKKRIKEGDLIICDTDKRKRFAALTRKQYLDSGMAHTAGDLESSESQVKIIQTVVNDHTFWLQSIMGCGKNWGHENRMAKNVLDKGEQVCSMVLLIKDHKSWSPDSETSPPSRPVVAGNCGLNSHLSELISHILEPITLEAPGCEIDSTSEMLSKIDKINCELANRKIEFQVQPNVDIASDLDVELTSSYV